MAYTQNYIQLFFTQIRLESELEHLEKTEELNKSYLDSNLRISISKMYLHDKTEHQRKRL